jgi:hypothetical protein
MKYVLLPLHLAALVAAAGCVGNDQSLTIERFVPLDPTACTASPTSTDIQSQGLLDVGLVSSLGSPGYMVFPVVENHLPASANVATDVEHHGIIVTGVNVELVPDATLAGVIPVAQRKFFAPAGVGRVEPLGEVAFGVEIIPRPMAISIAKATATGVGNSLPLVIAKMSPVGDYSGTTIIGAAVSFPVQICSFCLSGTPAACPPGGFAMADVKDGSCFPAEDLSITCCVDQQVLLCGPAVPMKTN